MSEGFGEMMNGVQVVSMQPAPLASGPSELEGWAGPTASSSRCAGFSEREVGGKVSGSARAERERDAELDCPRAAPGGRAGW